MPTSPRPLDSARFAPFWSGNTSTLTPGLPAALHFALCAVASAACVVPFSTAALWPQRAASELNVGPPVDVDDGELVDELLLLLPQAARPSDAVVTIASAGVSRGMRERIDIPPSHSRICPARAPLRGSNATLIARQIEVNEALQET